MLHGANSVAACSTANQFKDEIFWHPADEVLCGFSVIIGFIYSSQSLLNSQGGLSHFAMRQAHRGHYRGPKSLTLKAVRTRFFSKDYVQYWIIQDVAFENKAQ